VGFKSEIEVMTQKVLVASGNSAKLAELRSLCADLPVEIIGPEDLPDGLPEVEEDRDTFLDNAIKKAFSAAAAAERQLGPGIWALADDSGLCVDALDGAPGIFSARFAGLDESLPRVERDAANNQLLLEKLQGVPDPERGAAFWCVIAVARPDELLFGVEGSVEGTILHAEEGAGGFGYDPLFYHETSGCSMALLNPEDKAAISHRGEAVAKLRNVLQTVLPPTTP